MTTQLEVEAKYIPGLSFTNGLQLIPKNEYCAVLRKYLSEECFKPDTKHIFHYVFWITFYLVGLYGIVITNFFPLKLFISVLMGIALGSLTFFLHDLFHDSIIKSRPVAYLIGLSIGIFNLFSPLFWERVHKLHHATTGSVHDPDRSYIWTEGPKNLITKFVYKIRMSDESVHPFLSLVFISTGFFWYFFNTMFFGLIAQKFSIKEDKKYQRIQELFKRNKEKLVVLTELTLIFLFQVFLFLFISKANFLTYFLISLLPVAIAHFIAMTYIHTNHFLSPLTGELDDPLVNSLSLKNSWFVDKLFSNFSHHVEHHLFPAMSSSHYPKVRKLLLKLYPNRFQLMPMIDAIKLLFKTPRIYASDYVHLITSDSKKKIKCLLPLA